MLISPPHRFIFAIVRDPWDWEVSMYHYIAQTPQHEKHGEIEWFGYPPPGLGDHAGDAP